MTPEEKYWADRRAKEEREAQERRAKEAQEQQIGWFSNLWNNFGFFELILMALVIGGLWMAARANPEFVQDLVKKLPDSWQETVSGFLSWAGIDVDMKPMLEAKHLPEFQKLVSEKLELDEATVKSIIQRPEDQKALLQLISDANAERDATGQIIKAGKVNARTLMSTNTIYELIKQKPDFVAAIARASMKDGADKPLSATAQKFVGALQEIVNSDRVDVLLGQHRATVLSLVETLRPGSSAALNGMITAGLDNAGKASPELRQYLSNLLTLDSNGSLPTQQATAAATSAYVAARPQAAVDALKAYLASDEGKQFKPFLEHNDGKAYKALVAKFGADANAEAKALQFLTQLAAQDRPAMLKTALENRAILKAYTDNADLKQLPEKVTLGGKDYYPRAALEQFKAMPEAAVKPTLAMIEKGVDPLAFDDLFKTKNGKLDTQQLTVQLLGNPQMRATILKAGPENVVALVKAYAPQYKLQVPAELTGPMVEAIVKAAEKIGTSKAAESDEAARNTLTVVTTFTQAIISKDLKIIGKLTPEELSEFCKIEQCSEAVKELLMAAKGNLPNDQAEQAQALLNHWEVVARLARSKEGAKLILDRLPSAKPATADSCKKPGLDAIDEIALKYWYGKDGLSDNIIGKNIEEIKALMLDLDKAKCVSVASLPPAPPKHTWGSTPFGFR